MAPLLTRAETNLATMHAYETMHLEFAPQTHFETKRVVRRKLLRGWRFRVSEVETQDVCHPVMGLPHAYKSIYDSYAMMY